MLDFHVYLILRDLVTFVLFVSFVIVVVVVVLRGRMADTGPQKMLVAWYLEATNSEGQPCLPQYMLPCFILSCDRE